MPKPDSDLIRRVTDELPLGIWIAKASTGEEVYANERFGQIMGTDLLGVASPTYAEPYGIHDRSGNVLPNERMPFVRALQANGPVEQDDIVIHRRDGARVFIRATAKPLFDANGQPELVVIAFNDITREVEAQRERDASEARAERAARMEAIGRLAAGIAHDFNNLLSVIRTTAFLVRHEPHLERRAADLDIIAQTTNLAASLTSALLGFAGRGQRTARSRGPVPVSLLVKGLSTIFGRSLEPRCQITTRLDAVRAIEGDPGQIEQVVMNLIFNASDAMADGGKLTLITRDDGERSIIEVEDTGSGIPDELRDHIFEPYVSSKPDVGHGRGLGLATAWGIVQGHGGALEVVRSGAAGTLMRVTLPSVPAEADLASAAAAEPAPLPRPTILLIEDVEAVRRVTARALALLGFDVVPVVDGIDAVAAFSERHASVSAVLLDLCMPGIDGRETLRRLRAIDPTVPVVFLSGYADAGMFHDDADADADGSLQKPVDIPDLKLELDRVIAARASVR